jgi:hypothetical protein
MRMRSNPTVVPVSQTPNLGQRDTHATLRDSMRDKPGTDEAKAPVFIRLQRDTKRDNEGTRASQGCPNAVRQLGRSRTVEPALTPEIRLWIDRVIVPALVRDFLTGLEEDASENLPSVGDSPTSNRQTLEEAK